MIKLNNKNITYVALADSSNSLKAPKEIWYADSSNSVKLVYRRKDALIEGEDYEKYHWLNGDGLTYINTKLKNITDKNITISFSYASNTSQGILFGSEVYSPTNRISMGHHLINDNYGIWFWDGNPGRKISDDYKNLTVILDAAQSKTFVNGISVTNYNPPQSELYNNILLFAYYRKQTIDSGAILKTSPVGTMIDNFIVQNTMNLIPCKLLKPVPKWLDANGIRRQVGECGMIDLISGKFYGNVNSVGTFTVENYYERKEWLCGRNGAYINTMHPLSVFEDAFEIRARIADNTAPNPDGGENDLFGVMSDDGKRCICFYARGSGRLFFAYSNILSGGNQIYYENKNVFSAKMSADNSNFTVICDGESKSATVGTFPQGKFGANIALFQLTTTKSQNYFHGDIAYFKITDTSSNTTKMDLIPCTLTMDLPASMDANNTPRTKGTSGMWDLVSDKFYGNVASSGTFKAVNLAEGVDYEVHQWLVANTPNGTNIELPLNTANFSFKRIWRDTFNDTLFLSNSEQYVYHAVRKNIQIWDIPNSTDMFVGNANRILNEEVIIYSTGGNLTIGDEEVPQLDYPPSIIRFRNADRTYPSQYSTSSIYVDGVERYIPVKLLRSIPSTYDANGIARQAGECGMYDTVNDVFYGNVANSGSFSVSD